MNCCQTRSKQSFVNTLLRLRDERLNPDASSPRKENISMSGGIQNGERLAKWTIADESTARV